LFSVKFEIGGGDRDPRTPTNEQDENHQPDESWECVWKCHTATPVHHMAFSPDGTLFATSGKSDRLVKVWYENKHRKFIYHLNYHLAILIDRFFLFSSFSIQESRTQSIDGWKFSWQSI
jgi:WD40 repeat protein